MDETVDVQAVTIGVGTVLAIAVLAYGTLLSETILGLDAATLATLTFAATFAALAILHGAYGRRDLAAAHAVAAVGLTLVSLATSGLQAAGGLLSLVVGGAYIAIVTIRARREVGNVAS